jgi:lipoate-protein ligase B
MAVSSKTKNWRLIELPVMDYLATWNLQHSLVAARFSGELDSDVVISVQHHPVFTLGRRGGRESIKVTERFLEESGIAVMQTERGGSVTFHGPGQLVVYPIICLAKAGLSADEYISGLEEAMIGVAGEWGIPAERNSLNRGVWAGGKKLGSIGVAIRRGITFHGLALNANVSLEPFEWVDPCGLKGASMTSMQQELSRELPLDNVKEALLRQLERVFEVQIVPLKRSEFEMVLSYQGTAR